MMTIRRAISSDLETVIRILNDASAWLHTLGIDQWPDGFASPERIGPYVALAEVWLIGNEHGQDIGTVRISPDADPDFWTVEESAELAMYVSKAAINRDYAGQGLGALMLRWVTDYAFQLGYKWVRLDAWRTNTRLHSYYRAHGWNHLRTVNVSGRNSGALFQKPAVSDIEARMAFANPVEQILEPGDRVYVPGRGPGIIIGTYDFGSDLDVVSDRFAHGVRPLPTCEVRLDGSDQIIVWLASDLVRLVSQD